MIKQLIVAALGLASGAMMTPNYPNAIQIPFQHASGGTYVTDIPFRGVLHTTQTKDYTPSANNYFGHSNPPHFTVVKRNHEVEVYQHYNINVAARALLNPTMPVNDVQTNRMAAIQIEICWVAEEIAALPVGIKDALRPLMRWIEQELGAQRVLPTFYGEEATGQGGIARMSAQNWTHFNGWCGHQHVPENEHWDPGRIDIAYLLT